MLSALWRRRAARRGLLLVVLALGAAWALPEDTQAIGCGSGWLFYNNAAHTTIVGAKIWSAEECGCQFYAWGTTSAYRVPETIYCY